MNVLCMLNLSHVFADQGTTFSEYTSFSSFLRNKFTFLVGKSQKLSQESMTFLSNLHCVKSVRIRSYSGPYFHAFGLITGRMRENTDQNNSEYGHFSHSVNDSNLIQLLVNSVVKAFL